MAEEPKTPVPPSGEEAIKAAMEKTLAGMSTTALAKKMLQAEQFEKDMRAHAKWVENTLVLICRRFGIAGGKDATSDTGRA